MDEEASYLVTLMFFVVLIIAFLLELSPEDLGFGDSPNTFCADLNTYAKIRGNSEYYFTNESHFPIGQKWHEKEGVTIYQAFLRFNTSGIPDEATITSAKLLLCGSKDFSEIDFSIRIQNGAEVNDTQFYDDGNFNTSKWNTAGYNEVILCNFTVLSKTGYTCLLLRSNRETEGIMPEVSEVVYAVGVENEKGRPKLVVEWGGEA